MSAPNRFVRTPLVARHPAHARRVIPLLLFTAMAVVSACGGGATPKAQSPDDDRERSPSEDSDAERASEDSTEEVTEAPVDPCADGTCFKCGESVCLKGWYCDASAPSGAACSWLPECAKSATCACVSKVLGSACSCTEEDGALHVRCS